MLAFISLMLLAPAPEREVVDRVAAVIEDEIITMRELEQKAQPFLEQLGVVKDPEERQKRRNEIYRQVLDIEIGERMVERELKQNRVQEDAKRENVIRAPIAGVVTNIAVARGETIAENALLATVLPKGSGLQAQLLVPTRAIGFVRPGNEVVLRYDSFPFQRFGQYRGTVEAVSRTVWSPGEKVGPMNAREPVYRIDVKLDKQLVSANGQEFALRPGMLVNADLLLEKRTVFEWVFEPVLEFRARLAGATG